MDDADWSIVEELQNGIPLCARPFAELACRCGLPEDVVLQRVRALCDEGAIRRFGPRLAHLKAGIAGNVMVVWQVPEEDVARIGQALAQVPDISHCYQRPPLPGFPYTLYSMVHGRTRAEVLRRVAEISQEVGVAEYVLLPTMEELKKSSPRYQRLRGDQ